MNKLTDIGRLVQGVHRVMYTEGNPDEKIAEILGLPLNDIWERITGRAGFSPHELEAIGAYFGFSARTLLQLGDGHPLSVSNEKDTEKPKRVRSKVYQRVEVAGRV